METTLSLTSEQEGQDFASKAEQIEEVRAALNEPVRALHKKRRLGVSVYEGILVYEKNKNAPDVLDIESTFYDSLTKEKLESYENMLIEVRRRRNSAAALTVPPSTMSTSANTTTMSATACTMRQRFCLRKSST